MKITKSAISLKLGLLLASAFGYCISTQTQAACTQTTVAQTEDSYTAKIIFGTVNLPSTHLMPPGTPIDTKVIPPTTYDFNKANAESLLWTCDKADLSKIYFLAATNGDDRVGGYWDLGDADGLKDVFATYFAYVGLHQSMGGISLNRYWQSIPITDYDEENNKILIRLKHLPTLQATLYRISTLPPSTGATSWYCGTGTLPTTGSYSCNQPSAYIQLGGSDDVYMSFARDKIGQDSATSFNFWGSDNGFGYGMNTTANVLKTMPSCAVRNNTPLVILPTISAQALNQGEAAHAPFQVDIECENLMKSGTAAGQTAIAFQANTNAYNQAINMGLVHSETTEYLLSDQYGLDNQLASGVGIQLFNTSNQKQMLFQNPNAPTGGGESAGWYPVLDGQPQNLGETVANHAMHRQEYQAVLKALPGHQATPGKVKSTATIVVKVQ